MHPSRCIKTDDQERLVGVFPLFPGLVSPVPLSNSVSACNLNLAHSKPPPSVLQPNHYAVLVDTILGHAGSSGRSGTFTAAPMINFGIHEDGTQTNPPPPQKDFGTKTNKSMHEQCLLTLISSSNQSTTLSATTTTTTTTSAAAASSTAADLEAICEAQASGYASACPQCLYTCADSSVPDQCYYSVFFSINYEQSMCEAHGGYDCKNRAINDVCSGS